MPMCILYMEQVTPLRVEEELRAWVMRSYRELAARGTASRDARYSKFTVASAHSSSHTNRTPCVWNDAGGGSRPQQRLRRRRLRQRGAPQNERG